MFLGGAQKHTIYILIYNKLILELQEYEERTKYLFFVYLLAKPANTLKNRILSYFFIREKKQEKVIYKYYKK